MDRVWRYLKGTAKIKVIGTTPERFINLCLVNKISLWGVNRLGEQSLVVRLAASNVKSLRPILRKSACRMHILKKSGLPFIYKKAFRRKGFLFGGLLFCFLLYVFSTFLWSVEINAPKPLKYINPALMKVYAQRYGLHPGVWKGFVDNKSIQEQLLKDFPAASWLNIDISGTKAIITIYERTQKPPGESSAPADVVANKDAVIDDVFVIKGTAAVSKGMTVRKGDILISRNVYPMVIEGGPEPPKDLAPTLIRAKGIVVARTWYEELARVPLKEESFYRTENSAYGYVIKFPDGTKKTFETKNFPTFEELNLAHWRNGRFAVEITLKKYIQIQPQKIIRSKFQAKKEAVEIAEKKLQKMLSPAVKVVNKNYIWYNIKDSVSVRAIWEVRENIGINR